MFMSLEYHLSFLGHTYDLVLCIVVWIVSVTVGSVLLPEVRKVANRLEQVALAGPWGLVFLVSALAAIKSGGTSMLSLLPIIQLGLAGFGHIRNHSPQNGAIRGLETAEEIQTTPYSAGPSYGSIILVFVFIVLVAQIAYSYGIMPYQGAGQWKIPFEDYAWWGMRSWQLAQNGIESASAATVLALSKPGEPVLHWYHWLDLWLGGYTAQWFGLNAFLVLLFIVYPLLFAMAAFCCVCLVSLFLSWNHWNWVLGFCATLATPLVNRIGLLSDHRLPVFLWAHSMFYYMSYLIPITLMIVGIIHVVRERHVLAGVSLSFAVFLGPPLVPLVMPGLLLLWLWGVTNIRLPTWVIRAFLVTTGAVLVAGALSYDWLGIGPSKFWPAQIVLALMGLGAAIGGGGLSLKPLEITRHIGARIVASWAIGGVLLLFLWLKLTAHGLRPYGNNSDVSISLRYWLNIFYQWSAMLAAAGILGLPFLTGVYKLWRSYSSKSEGNSIGLITVLSLAAFVISFSVFAASGGVGNLLHVPFLMWSTFLVPLGWAGLCKILAEGPFRWGAAVTMAALLATGIASTVNGFKEEQKRISVTFSPEQVKELGTACRHKSVGYFTPDGGRERHWWIPMLSGWAVLAECKMMRLNRVSSDMEGHFAQIWYQAAPAAFARSHGIEWQNTAPVMLGFAQEHGIKMIVESQDHPIPPEVRPYLEPLTKAGPFMLYHIADIPRLNTDVREPQ
jgi:hypothetical protein